MMVGAGISLACALRLTHDTDTVGTTGFGLLEQMWLLQNKRADVLEEICQSHPGREIIYSWKKKFADSGEQ